MSFVYYAIQCIQYKPGEHKRQWIEKYSKLEIPLPPLAVQKEIVRMLDGMAGLIGELEQELSARKQQYECCRDELLKITNGYKKLSLGDLVSDGSFTMTRGKVISKRDIAKCPDDYPIYSSSSVGDGEFGRYGKSFFERMFKTELTDAEFGDLKAIRNLAPGDFRTVRQEAFYLDEGQSNADLIAALREECLIKKDGDKTAKIGFGV